MEDMQMIRRSCTVCTLQLRTTYMPTFAGRRAHCRLIGIVAARAVLPSLDELFKQRGNEFSILGLVYWTCWSLVWTFACCADWRRRFLRRVFCRGVILDFWSFSFLHVLWTQGEFGDAAYWELYLCTGCWDGGMFLADWLCRLLKRGR